MDRYDIHKRDDTFFENLTWHLCFRLFGAGTEKFAKGKDGGKDARFEGMAERYPSRASPWSGTVIIQAKHTLNPIASCSDPDFDSIMKLESPRIAALKVAGKLDHYICFTNRKMSGVKGDALQTRLRNETGIPTLMIVGLDFIERLLVEFDVLLDKLGLSLPAAGLTIYPEDLEHLINYFDQNVDLFREDAPAPSEPPFLMTDWLEKNEINRLSNGYFRDVILEDSQVHFSAIQAFLTDLRNREWARRYDNITAQFRDKYYGFRDQFDAFERIFDDIFNRIKLRGQIPGGDRLIYFFLHYMYCNCDIGRRTGKSAPT